MKLRVNQVYQAALDYAKRGWRVLPVESPAMGGDGKKPLIKAWPDKATTNPNQIEIWWSKWPEANVGLATGEGLVALDIDSDLGEESLMALESDLGKLPDTVESHTGRGRHLLFRCSRPLPNRVGIAPGIDLRGERGFIVAPPSMHKRGVRYVWELSSGPDQIEIPEMPEAWVEDVAQPASGADGATGAHISASLPSPASGALVGEQRAAPLRQQAPLQQGERALLIPVGQRNDTLYRYACALRKWGAGEAALKAGLGAYFEGHCERSAEFPFLEAELDDIVRSALKQTPSRLDLALPDPGKILTWADMDAVLGPIEWAWPGWIPEGLLTLVVGPQGAGKSALALHLASCIIRGGVWPDGSPVQGPPGKIVWCETEAAQAINLGRAREWGLPLKEVLLPLHDPMMDVLVDDPAHKNALTNLAARKEVRMIVVDSLTGAHHRDENSSVVGEIVQWLSALARDTGIVIVLIHHIRKRSIYDFGDRISIDMIRGHSSIPQSSRSILAIDAPDMMNPARKRLYRIKGSNTSPHTEEDDIGLEIGPQGLDFGDVPVSAKAVPVMDQACELLLEKLKDGPVRSSELREEFEAEGISWRTAHRVKNNLGINVKRDGNIWYWSLIAKEADQG